MRGLYLNLKFSKPGNIEEELMGRLYYGPAIATLSEYFLSAWTHRHMSFVSQVP